MANRFNNWHKTGETQLNQKEKSFRQLAERKERVGYLKTWEIYHAIFAWTWVSKSEWKWLLPPQENNPHQIYATHTPVEDAESASQKLTVFYSGNSILMLWLLLFYSGTAIGAIGSLATVGAMGMLANQISQFQSKISLAKQGEEAERHIASLLKTLCGRGCRLYSKLDDTRLRVPGKGDLDVLLNLEGVRFAISVKSKRGEKVKVFYDRDHHLIRYSYGGTKGSKGWFKGDIAQELNEQVEWLRAHRAQFFSAKRPPWKIVVLCSPVGALVEHPLKVVVFPDSPFEEIGQVKFLKDKDVYVVAEQELVNLIQLLRRKS